MDEDAVMKGTLFDRSRWDVEAATRWTTRLRASNEPYWECLRRRLLSDHGFDAADVVMVDFYKGVQGGDEGTILLGDDIVAVFTFDFSAAPAVDDDIGRFFSWDERRVTRDAGQGDPARREP